MSRDARRRHPGAVSGAEFAPIPPAAQELVWRAGHPAQVRCGGLGVEQPGPHYDACPDGLRDPTPRVVDLRDPDTALMVLSRAARVPGYRCYAAALAQVLLSGRWTQDHLVQLGNLCRAAWGP